ncbi:MAG: hypothetical protein ACK5Z5_00825 [Neisseriaceae bacterium]
MINKVLMAIAISSISLVMLAACGSGSSSNNTVVIHPSITATVLLPNESGGSIGPGNFTDSSCIGIKESSTCMIKLTWANLPTESAGTILDKSSFNYTGESFSVQADFCQTEMQGTSSGSCTMSYNFTPASNIESYESSPAFSVFYFDVKNKHVGYAVSNKIEIKASVN